MKDTKTVLKLPGKSLEVKKYMNWKNTQEIRKKVNNSKRLKKHANLRKYAQLCKREGIESDRVKLLSTFTGKESSSMTKNISKSIKVPFSSSIEIAKKRQEEKDLQMKIRQEKLKKVEDAKKNREEKRKELMQHTRKGQPKLDNHIKHILSKLQSE